MEAGNDFVLDSAHNEHRACGFSDIINCWVEDSLDEEFELGHHWHEMVDHISNRAEAILQYDTL